MTSAAIRLCLAAAVAASAGVAAPPAVAQSNVLERWFGPPKGEKPPARPKPKRESSPGAPPLASVPVPDARPRAPDEPETEAGEGAAAAAQTDPDAVAPPAGSAGTDGASAGSGAEAGPLPAVAETPDAAPLPEKRPEPPAGAKAPAAEADEGAAAPEGRAADAPALEAAPTEAAGEGGSREAPDGPPSETGDPRATAEKPVEEIPVPEERPDAPAQDAAPRPAAPAAPATPPQTAAPQPEPEDAPNSTDKLKARVPTISPAETVLAAAAIQDAEVCEAELKRRGVAFTVGESISEGECGVLRPVNVTVLSSGVKVTPKTEMLCRTALALDDWMTKSVVPAAKADLPGDRLTEFRHASTYVCRPRASESGISEHARGSAIDIAAFVFGDGKAGGGKEIGIAAQPPGTPEARFQDAVRAAACGPFKTVLGPGTDADHATHFHLDIAARSNGSTYCK